MGHNDPLVRNDTYAMTKNRTLSGTVLDNDQIRVGNMLQVTLVSGTGHGKLTLNVNGTFNCTPAASYTGADILTYTATDWSKVSKVVKDTLSVA